jgi:epoxyqueuosine reductase
LAAAVIGDPEPLVRAHAAWALGQIGGGAVRRVLERACRDPDPLVRSEAAAARDGA